MQNHLCNYLNRRARSVSFHGTHAVVYHRLTCDCTSYLVAENLPPKVIKFLSEIIVVAYVLRRQKGIQTNKHLHAQSQH